MDTPNQVAEEPGEMSLWDHVGELRDRLFKAVIALAIGTALGFALSQQALEFIIAPYGNRVLVTNPTESLTNVFQVSVTLGAAIAMPVIVYQVLAFIMPGLLPSEKKWLFIGVPAATGLFILGAAFAYYIMLPPAVSFLTGIYPTVFKYDLKLDDYVPFVLGIMFWIGVAFEMPLVVFIAAKFNLVSARAMARQWRYAVIGIAIIAAFITPTPDPINMSLVMAPLFVLYLLSIALAALARRGKQSPTLMDAQNAGAPVEPPK